MNKSTVYGSQEADSPERSKQGALGRIMYRPFWLFVYTLCKLLFRLQVEGREKLPDGPFILRPCTGPSSTPRSSE